jgi:hypothetical protein
VCVFVTIDSSHRLRRVTSISLPFSARRAYSLSSRGCYPSGIPRPCLRRLSALCASAVNYMFSAVCRLLKSLCALFRTPFLCFQQLADSFHKMPGWGGHPECFYGTPGVAYPLVSVLTDPLPGPYALLYLPLESTLPKVYQNKQLYLPLESTLVKNPGGGGPSLRHSDDPRCPAQWWPLTHYCAGFVPRICKGEMARGTHLYKVWAG